MLSISSSLSTVELLILFRCKNCLKIWQADKYSGCQREVNWYCLGACLPVVFTSGWEEVITCCCLTTGKEDDGGGVGVGEGEKEEELI